MERRNDAVTEDQRGWIINTGEVKKKGLEEDEMRNANDPAVAIRVM